jgi:hypothetical protein
VCLCWAPDPNSLRLGAWGHKGVKAQIFFPTKKWLTKNVNHFAILVSHSRPKYIGNMKWLTKITNG